ncbi:MAG: DUF4878 domain-containing protein [Bacteroides oleiciplenus]|uniref:DUF4878 domain-containing protein n=1 Tax=uncultured Bacteroides sp. TaxID=162156 RepID=UPI0025EE0AC3|nr:DUF4878 domain-containing protein [uncultured Bacteroides sp.]MBD9091715.1 DUF4878 domain-containing protein [Bacteroides oleiciplenus]
MKKVFYFSLMVMTMFVMAACSSSSGPGDSMKKYCNDLIKGNYEKFVDGIALGENVTSDELKKQKDGLVAMMRDKVSKEYEKMGGLKSIEILSEEISEDGNTATVKIKQTYGNGETQEGTQSMVKRDGKWLMSIDK